MDNKKGDTKIKNRYYGYKADYNKLNFYAIIDND